MKLSINHISVGTRYSGSWNASQEAISEAWGWFEANPEAQAWAENAQVGDTFEYMSGVYFARVA